MENDLILQIRNVGPISNAKIDIGKINVVGGINSSGKSTASKLLYSFLRTNSSESDEILKRNLPKNFRKLINRLRWGFDLDLNDQETLRKVYLDLRKSRYSKNESLELDEIYDYYDIIENIFYKYYNENDNWGALDKKYMNLKDDLDSLDKIIKSFTEDDDIYYISILKELIDLELNIKRPDLLGGYARLYSSKLNFSASIDFYKYLFYHRSSFPIEQIYYLDSFSILDNKNINGLFETDHVKKLSEDFKSEYRFKAGDNEKFVEKIQNLEKQISALIKGEIMIEKSDISFILNGSIITPMKNTASGVKQIGVIQKLLSNHLLLPDSFLIIDEPEVNLHPEWQIKLARILVLLVSELNINIYINTHSPMFIEAITLFSEYYGLLDETNLYLTEVDTKPNDKDRKLKIYEDIQKQKQAILKNEDKLKEFDIDVDKLFRDPDEILEEMGEITSYNFKKVNPKNMGEIYENLSRPYDDLDDLKSQILFKKE